MSILLPHPLARDEPDGADGADGADGRRRPLAMASTPAPTGGFLEEFVHTVQRKGLFGASDLAAEKHEVGVLVMRVDEASRANQVLLLDAYPGNPPAPISTLIRPLDDLRSLSAAGNLGLVVPPPPAVPHHAGSSRQWNKIASNPQFQLPLGNPGGFNAAFTLFLAMPGMPLVPSWFPKMFGNGGLQKVAMRQALNDPSGGTRLRDVVIEFVLAAYASRKGVGPKQYAAMIIPKQQAIDDAKSGNGITLSNFHRIYCRDYAEKIVSFAEAFEGDNQCFKRAALMVKTIPMSRNERYADNYWEMVSKAIVRGSKCGFVHGDLKPANMLYKMDPTNPKRIAEMVYTDFDPYFVRVIDMESAENQGLVVCIALLMMMCYLNFILCYRTAGWDDDAVAEMIDLAMEAIFDTLEKEGYANARDIKDQLEEGKDQALSAILLECDLEVLKPQPRTSGRQAGTTPAAAPLSAAGMATRKEIVAALRAHANSYLRPGAPDWARCRPSGGAAADWGKGTLRQLIEVALKNSSQWHPV